MISLGFAVKRYKFKIVNSYDHNSGVTTAVWVVLILILYNVSSNLCQPLFLIISLNHYHDRLNIKLVTSLPRWLSGVQKHVVISEGSATPTFCQGNSVIPVYQ